MCCPVAIAARVGSVSEGNSGTNLMITMVMMVIMTMVMVTIVMMIMAMRMTPREGAP